MGKTQIPPLLYMTRKDPPVIFLLLLLYAGFFAACNNSNPPPQTDIAATPEELDPKVTEVLQSSVKFAMGNNGVLVDSTQLDNINLVEQVYQKKSYKAVWSEKEQWKPLADSMFEFIENAKLYGLFPHDYHFASLDTIKKIFAKDSLGRAQRRDAVIWANADMMLTDAFMHIVRDLKLGRLPKDSVTLRADSVLTDEFYVNRLALSQKYNSLTKVFHALEPKHEGYHALKNAIPGFLDSADYRSFTVVPSPKSKTPDFKKLLQKRLFEGGYIASDTTVADSLDLAEALKKFQRAKNITVDGRAGEETVKVMNLSDQDRFVRIAISLDRYKLLPEQMPERYVWVNLPAYYMQFWEFDTLRITSKIICGKPNTRTPLLTSAISELVTYPQWTIPESIIAKEIIPGQKKNPEYLAKKGYSLINSKGEEVSPDSVNWMKYSKGIPYKVVQGSGDDNALGILKFNFPNKYAVYLHDTNQRYLFAQSTRSLSHGCVRVQDWEKLAYSIVRYDNKELDVEGPSPAEDSMTSWLKRKERHSIWVRNKLPVYIRYFTAEARNGRIAFYDDIYGEDKLLQQRYFRDK
jgi:L,D-transpeptidase YcbB